MTTPDQTAVIDFLGRRSTHAGAAVERIDTHSSIVFLAGTRAWKLKRAVRFDYLDFSTPALRKACCEAEVRLNRRTAPQIYRGVAAVTRQHDGSLAIDGAGEPIDWVVEMNRFEQDALLDRLAGSGALALELMRPLGAEVARFHLAAERRADHGGTRGMEWVVAGNAAGFAEFGVGVLDVDACRRLTDSARKAIARHRALLDARRVGGWVRQCHGDLHLRNLVLLDGQPTLFDAVEFNDDIACVDVLYDLAFLLMDLWRRGLPRHANTVWNSYLGAADDIAGLPLMPLFLSCRAAVRAKTSTTAARLQTTAAAANELEALARDYLALAARLLDPPRPQLVAIGGLSGSGKSTLAQALAPQVLPVAGAVVLRSDEIRKRLCGVSPETPLGPEGYRPEVSARVYDLMADHAGRIVQAGHSTIVDAVCGRPEDRRTFEEVAMRSSVGFVGLWLDVPERALVERVLRRQADASDADEAVVRQQLAQDVGEISWSRIEASSPPAVVLAAAMSRLHEAVAASG